MAKFMFIKISLMAEITQRSRHSVQHHDPRPGPLSLVVAPPNRAIRGQARRRRRRGPGVSAAAQPPKARAVHAGPRP